MMRPIPTWLTTALLACVLSACGSGSSDTAAAPPGGGTAAPPDTAACSDDCGTVLIGLTDADGDFLQYSVAVSSLSLERRDGVRVETLPQAATVDFAQYTELTEFLSAATVPPGTYVAASITLDYAGAGITVERSGEAVEAAVVDAAGAPLGVETLELLLADDRPLVIAPGLPSLMVVDFDLAASHEVDLDTDPITAVAAPFLVAEIDPVEHKEMRLRGPLVSVDTAAGSYRVALRPFWLWRGDFGRVTVHVSADTAFEIDGVGYSGSDGLEALAGMPAGTATLARGNLDVPDHRFTAKEVYAGSSVPGHAADVVRGVITARSGDVLEVSGATLVRERDTVVFRGEIEVLVGPGTAVRKAGAPDFDGGSGALSVGQRLVAFGRVDDTSDRPRLDAGEGRVRMLRTVANGEILHLADALLHVDLQEIAGRRASIFDFAGTGLPGLDADPDDYEIATGALDLSGLASGHPVKAAGFVTPFGAAPPDFDARTLGDFADVRARLRMNWNPPSPAPFLTAGPEGLALDLANPDSGAIHHVSRGGIRTDLLALSGATILPSDDRPGVFGIRDGRSIRLYGDFPAFTEALAELLGAGRAARSVYASGSWFDERNEIVSGRILIRLN